jgi:hypothetical protein
MFNHSAVEVAQARDLVSDLFRPGNNDLLCAIFGYLQVFFDVKY